MRCWSWVQWTWVTVVSRTTRALSGESPDVELGQEGWSVGWHFLSLVPHLCKKTFLWVYRQSTSVPVWHSSVFPMGILFLSSSSYSPPRKPCLYKCKNSLIKTESFECAHALVYKVKRVCFKHYIGLSLLLVLCIAPTGFLQVPRFFPSSKFSISKLRIRPGMVDKEPLCWCATSDSLFIIFLNDA